jgi:hypothetical protein
MPSGGPREAQRLDVDPERLADEVSRQSVAHAEDASPSGSELRHRLTVIVSGAVPEIGG